MKTRIKILQISPIFNSKFGISDSFTKWFNTLSDIKKVKASELLLKNMCVTVSVNEGKIIKKLNIGSTNHENANSFIDHVDSFNDFKTKFPVGTELDVVLAGDLSKDWIMLSSIIKPNKTTVTPVAKTLIETNIKNKHAVPLSFRRDSDIDNNGYSFAKTQFEKHFGMDLNKYPDGTKIVIVTDDNKKISAHIVNTVSNKASYVYINKENMVKEIKSIYLPEMGDVRRNGKYIINTAEILLTDGIYRRKQVDCTNPKIFLPIIPRV